MPSPMLYVRHAGSTYVLDRREESGGSAFGGPYEGTIGGVDAARPPHLVATLHHVELPFLGAPAFAFELPLLYGLRYDGGEWRYAFGADGVVIDAPTPEHGGDAWPYRGYPELLPYFPLAVVERKAESWAAFARRAPHAPPESNADVVVLVPPPRGLGFTMWGRTGDAEGVTLVFEADLAAKRVRAYNVCG